MQNIGQGHQVKVPGESVHREEALYKVWWLKATVEDIWKDDVKGVKVSGVQNIGQGHSVKVPAVRTLRRSIMQGLMVVGLIVEEILNVDVKCVKGTGAQNIGQGTGLSYLPSQYI